MEMRKGCRVPFPEEIKEGWEITETGITANVSTANIELLLGYFILRHEEPIFFYLELPCREDEEEKIQPGFGADVRYIEELGMEASVVRKMHKNVYYLDGCTQEEALCAFAHVEEILVPDGMAEFGFGGHESGEEIGFEKYNVVTIHTSKPEFYRPAFEKLNIPQVTGLVTAWDTFSPEHPGRCDSVELDGKSAYDIPEMLKDWGMYLAETREE